MKAAAETPGSCILIFAMLAVMFTLALSIAAISLTSQSREFFCVDLTSSTDASTATIQFHLDSHAISYSLRYRPVNTTAQLTLLQILKQGSEAVELCASGCATIEQDTCAQLQEPPDCKALAGEVSAAEVVRDMRQNPLLYSFHITTTDAELYSISMGASCPFF